MSDSVASYTRWIKGIVTGIEDPIYIQWLKEKDACSEGFEWWMEHKESDVKKLALKLLKAEHFGWASWMLTKCFDKTQNVKYAVFASEQVIGIYEAKYPDDNRPRKAGEVYFSFNGT